MVVKMHGLHQHCNMFFMHTYVIMEYKMQQPLLQLIYGKFDRIMPCISEF